MKKISIIIPTYNSSKTIIRCLNSVIKQTYKNWEIIIIDSYSKDNTINLIKNFNSKKIKILSLSKNKTISEARYKGVCNSKGDLIAFLDSDDEWSPKKLDFQMNKMRNNNFFSCTNFTMKNKNDYYKVNINKNFLNIKDLIYNRPIALSSVIIEKKIIKKTIKKNLSLNFAEDYFWWTDVLRSNGKCIVIRKFLTNIYIHDKNRSVNFMKNYISLFNIYRKNFGFNYFKIFFVFIRLIINTFSKNIFKMLTFKKKLV